jgi:hypothetical protein
VLEGYVWTSALRRFVSALIANHANAMIAAIATEPPTAPPIIPPIGSDEELPVSAFVVTYLINSVRVGRRNRCQKT